MPTPESRRGLTEAEVAAPPSQVGRQLLHHLLKTDPTTPSRQYPDPPPGPAVPALKKRDGGLLAERPQRAEGLLDGRPRATNLQIERLHGGERLRVALRQAAQLCTGPHRPFAVQRLPDCASPASPLRVLAQPLGEQRHRQRVAVDTVVAHQRVVVVIDEERAPVDLYQRAEDVNLGQVGAGRAPYAEPAAMRPVADARSCGGCRGTRRWRGPGSYRPGRRVSAPRVPT